MKYNYNLAYFQKSADYVRSRIDFTPEIAIILGTGCGPLADEIQDAVVVPYEEIPNFLVSTVSDHAGKLICGTLMGKKVICMNGRFHYYEGYDFEQLTAPVRLFKLLGVQKTIVTNAAGAVNTDYAPGDVVILKDHLNFFNVCPTRGPNVEELGPRFFDVSDIYTKALREIALDCAARTELVVHEGVYMYFPGPHFETAAEIRAARLLGADCVGMSTVPEALTAAHCSMPLLGISLMTNMATGLASEKLGSGEVSQTAQNVETPFKEFIKDIISHL